MKKKNKYILFLLVAMFTLLFQAVPVAANANNGNVAYIPITPLWQSVSYANITLSVSGTTAHCNATIVGLPGTTRISATMQLIRVSDGVAVAAWGRTSTSSRLVMNESASVSANGNYRLILSAAITRNGVVEHINLEV